MFSFGREPYETIPVKQIKKFLITGQRMDKPTYADAKMYVCFALIDNHIFELNFYSSMRILQKLLYDYKFCNKF